ncbi:MAG: tRNA (adenosine(37)-N6)-dimethylallyltransferase MiaA [Xanthomonadales bacterium]|nr:tRNA (adenosine(37)-N6)-dimethylallyltransferase MiaA [Xanthomonadales bacterium]
MTDPPVIALMGPTAAGKTGLAIELVQRYPLQIVSVDSAQVYRGMDIGTAKPGPDELAVAPHRLIDNRDPDQGYSAAEFCTDAQQAIDEIRTAGETPLLVGGTMLYFRAFFEGLSPLPDADPVIREALEAEAAKVGWGQLHKRLQTVDPVAAQRIRPTDPQRIQRALEVHELTGKPLSELQQAPPENPHEGRSLKLIACPAERSRLHARIAERCEAMFEAGLVAEVRRLLRRFGPEATALRSVGYRQVLEALQEGGPSPELRQKVLYATRQLAKRQLTWLRKEADAQWLDPEDRHQVAQAFAAVEKFLKH